VDVYFDKLYKYIKAWFFNEEKIMNYINEEKIEYKYVKSLIENGKEFKEKGVKTSRYQSALIKREPGQIKPKAPRFSKEDMNKSQRFLVNFKNC